MFKNTNSAIRAFNNKKQNNKSIFKLIKKNFQILTPEEYLVNMNESLKRMSVESCVLRPLPEASN